MIVDYHMHLRDPEERIDHSLEAVEKFVEAAAERGVDEICFTEHVYYFVQTRRLWDQQYMLERCVHDLDRYVGAIIEAKERGLPVKLGLEVDYLAGRERETADVLAPYPWDYLLGSVHFVDGFPVDQEPGLVEKLGPTRPGAATSSGCGTRRGADCSTRSLIPTSSSTTGRDRTRRRSNGCTRRRPTRSKPRVSASKSPPPACTSPSASSTPTHRCSRPVTLGGCRSRLPRMRTRRRTSVVI